MNSAPDAPAGSALPMPGPLGRAARLGVGAFQLWIAAAVAVSAGAIVRRPPDGPGFWIVVAWALWLVPEIANLGLLRERRLGRKPLGWVALALTAVALASLATRETLWSPATAAVTIGLAIAVHAYVGLSHVVAALAGVPGCELRTLAYLASRARGRATAPAVCPGLWTPLDRWEARRRRG